MYTSSVCACLSLCVWSWCLCCQQATNARWERVIFPSEQRKVHSQHSVASPPCCITLPQPGMSVLVSVHVGVHCTTRTEGCCLDHHESNAGQWLFITHKTCTCDRLWIQEIYICMNCRIFTGFWKSSLICFGYFNEKLYLQRHKCDHVAFFTFLLAWLCNISH